MGPRDGLAIARYAVVFASALVALAMAILLCAAPAFASGELDSQDGHWKYVLLSDGTAKVTYCDAALFGGDTWEIPSKVDNHVISTLGEKTFSGNDSVRHVVVPASVKFIGTSAFASCANLEEVRFKGTSKLASIGNECFLGDSSLRSITLPGTVESIGSHAFYKCSRLESMVIPDKVTNIRDCTFSFCDSLRSVTLPSGLKTIGKKAFSDCRSLQSVAIPTSVAAIGEFAFSGCRSITYFAVAAGNQAFKSSGGVLLGDSGETLVCYPPAKADTSYAAPRGLKTVLTSAFLDCEHLESIELPKGTISMQGLSIQNCANLRSLKLPESIEKLTSPVELGFGAFNKGPFNTSEYPDITVYVVDGSFAQRFFTNAKVRMQTYVPEEDPEEAQPGQSDNPQQVAVDSKTPVKATDKLSVITSKNGTAALVSMPKSHKPSAKLPSSVMVNGVKYKLTSVKAYAFKNLKRAKTVTLPNTIKRVDAKAFAKSKIAKARFTVAKGRKLTVSKKAFKGSKVKKVEVTMSKKAGKKQKDAIIRSFKLAGIAKQNIKIRLK